MKSHMHKKTAILASAAFLLAAGVSVGTAAAYFTTYATASGGVQINLGFTTTVPEETVSNWTKHVKVTNTGDHECYVRVKAFAGEAYQKGLSYSDEDGKWTPGYCEKTAIIITATLYRLKGRRQSFLLRLTTWTVNRILT